MALFPLHSFSTTWLHSRRFGLVESLHIMAKVVKARWPKKSLDFECHGTVFVLRSSLLSFFQHLSAALLCQLVKVSSINTETWLLVVDPSACEIFYLPLSAETSWIILCCDSLSNQSPELCLPSILVQYLVPATASLLKSLKTKKSRVG